MVDHEATSIAEGDRVYEPFVRHEYETVIPQISDQLHLLATPSFSSHINWHIKNFIFDPKTHILYYLDLKPSSIFGRWRNEKNLRNIRRDFLR
jgi:23S rRNA maturation mini-RNase III